MTAALSLPIWMINLDRATERRARMEAQFETMGLTVTRIAAIDGKAEAARIAPMADTARFTALMGRPPLAAELGCYLSHLEAWRQLIDSGAEVGLVLEDDVVFHDNFLPAVAAALTVRDQWDMLKLNRIRAKLPLRQGRVQDWQLNAYLGPATGFGAYLITAELAARLLPRLLPIRLPIDYEATRFFEHDFRLIGLEPFPSHVDDGGNSTITGQNFAEVVKPRRHKRLGNYAMRAGNYLRRAYWLSRRGMLAAWKRNWL
ncbi:MAG: glycosyltransferase family 25 protein [Pseudotabrizicola sp.]|uniref:glycosyltransferase family 25 protein n=1 Tax=Pseudotabrizicola sp. TaxID=2939647 RepID=UPI00271A027B|nr:glycosyltransferase family 25 protein [Pseudotabrizicola sp.]MDO9637863.1 glycosyltransferase family 25 protein [Pseudotabrizicola sp.]